MFIDNVKGEDLTGVAAALQGKEAQGVPELSVSGGGARCSIRWGLARSGVVRWRSALRGGGDGAEEKRMAKRTMRVAPLPFLWAWGVCG